MYTIEQITETKRRIAEANRLAKEVEDYEATQKRIWYVEHLAADVKRDETWRRIKEAKRLHDRLEVEDTLSRIHHANTLV